ncbi:calcium/calmodulin-dependent protein kinase type IV isoform X5 [Hydra vulgaris]
MMNMLHHKRLILLHDAFETPKEMIVIMELVTGGELFEKVVEEDHLTERQVIRYMKQVFYGVQHMHSKNMVHLDLKPENILCLSGGKPGYEEIKLIDFGMTRVLKPGEKETAMCGTPEFVAPEVISFNPITLAADIWSIGVITYVLLSGISPFMGDDDTETLNNVTTGVYDYEDDDGTFDNISDDAKLFIDECLTLDPRKRLTIDDALSHKWIKNEGSEKKLNTANLKKFIARRRWQRTMNTIKAVSRLAGGLNIKGTTSACMLGCSDFLSRVKIQDSLEREQEKCSEETIDSLQKNIDLKCDEKKDFDQNENDVGKKKDQGNSKSSRLLKQDQVDDKKIQNKFSDKTKQDQINDKKKQDQIDEKKKQDHINDRKKQDQIDDRKKQEQIDDKKKQDQIEDRKKQEQIDDKKKQEQIDDKKKQDQIDDKKKQGQDDNIKKKDQIDGRKNDGTALHLEDKLKGEDFEDNDSEERKLKREEERKRRQDERNIKNAAMQKSDSLPMDINENVITEASIDENKNHVLSNSLLPNGVKPSTTLCSTSTTCLTSTTSCLNSKTNKDLGTNKISHNVLRKVELVDEVRTNRSQSLTSPSTIKRNQMPSGNVKDRAAAFQQGDVFWKNKR